MELVRVEDKRKARVQGDARKALSVLRRLDRYSVEFMHFVSVLINRLVPGIYSEELQRAFRQRVPAVKCVAVTFRAAGSGFEVFLKRVGEGWVCPAIAWDVNEPEADVVARLRKENGFGFRTLKKVTFFAEQHQPGTTVHVVYWVVPDIEPSEESGRWFNHDELPTLSPSDRTAVLEVRKWFLLMVGLRLP